jgi:amidase
MSSPISGRRHFLKQVSLTAASASVLSAKSFALTGTMPGGAIPDDLVFTSAKRLAAMIRTKKVSSTEVVKAYLARIDAVNPKTHAVVQLCRERALAEAANCDKLLARGELKGLLHGVPCTIKDSFDTAGVISTLGSLGRKDFVPTEDATVVARVRKAGAILLGKTNTPEFTLSRFTENYVYGRTYNPYKLTHSPGGSSGGSGANVASGGAAFDIGSDSGGSVRWPSHFNGIAGLKPSAGRVPRTGQVPSFAGMFDSMQQIGPMARWVEDLIYLLPIIAGPDNIDPSIHPMPLGSTTDVEIASLRIAYYTDNGSNVKPTAETIAAVELAAKHFASLGAKVTQDAPTSLLHEISQIRGAIQRGDGGAWIDRMAKNAATTKTHPLLRRGGNAVTTAQFTDLLEQLDNCRSKLLGWFTSKYDLIVCPVHPTPAELYPPEGEYVAPATPTPGAPVNPGYTGIYNTLGWPSAVVRAGTSPDGLPIGIQMIARPWNDHVSLAVAAALEAKTGGWQKPPI